MSKLKADHSVKLIQYLKIINVRKVKKKDTNQSIRNSQAQVAFIHIV